MNERRMYLETILFGKPDKIPFAPGLGRISTLKRWHSEGLPADIVSAEGAVEYAYRMAGGKEQLPEGGEGFSVYSMMVPQFEEKVLEQKANSKIVQDWQGNICEIGNEYPIEYLRWGMDFVTRRWIKFPVETRADWEDMKKRYDPELPERLPEDASALGKRLEKREHYVSIYFGGPYWQLREWLGFEKLSMLFYDDPDLIKDMLKFWQEYVLRLLERSFKYCIPDQFYISEDMAFKGQAMVSPAMIREFLLPVWKKWGEYVHSAGVPIYAIDSDGYVGGLIPFWIEAGMNVCDPMEVAAGNDIVVLRKKFGKNIAFKGGVDKRKIAKGGHDIIHEIQHVEPVIKDGGYIPSCDHGVPSDVSWSDYVDYCRLLARATGWLT